MRQTNWIHMHQFRLLELKNTLRSKQFSSHGIAVRKIIVHSVSDELWNLKPYTYSWPARKMRQLIGLEYPFLIYSADTFIFPYELEQTKQNARNCVCGRVELQQVTCFTKQTIVIQNV